jgi:hypothetical protein
MTWTDEPATRKQIMSLREYGYKPDHPLTKTEASEIIVRLGGQPEPGTTAPAIHPALLPVGPYRLRLNVQNAQRAIDAGETNYGGCSREELLTRAITERREFWRDTCCEVTQMHHASPQVTELYRKFGCRYDPPTQHQVQEILEALDPAMPSWDRDHPELFFQTLELNHPELLRQRLVG